MAVARILQPLINLPRPAKRVILGTADAALCALAVWLAFYLRLGEWVPFSDRPLPAVFGSMLIALPIFSVLGVYRAISRYAQDAVLTLLIVANLAYGVIYALIFTTYGVPGVPRTIGLIQPALLFVLMLTIRVAARHLLGAPKRIGPVARLRPRVLIYGAGDSGRQISAALTNRGEMTVVGFLDDSSQIQGATINGIRVHKPDNLPALYERLDVTEVLLAIPSASRFRRNEVLSKLRHPGIAVRTLPDLMHVARGEAGGETIQELDIRDVLGRDPVSPDEEFMRHRIVGRVVMVTGAGGSIGSELCRQILKVQPTKLLLFDSSEFALYTIHRELERTIQLIATDLSTVELIPLLGSVRDRRRVDEVINSWRPDIVYHAAAYKHVPLVEHNLIEGVSNNAFGTFAVASACAKYSIPRFVLISTDKAVRPTNVMGATKRLAELILQAMHADNSVTCFSMVRFGNVLGSSGSVVPLFRQQIAHGGPITITDERITRFFMTISEAAQLVIQAGTMATGGEVFVLDMGEPVRIADLARNMIELSGLTVRNDDNPHGDIELKVVGLRPGEKLYEELLIGDAPILTAHARIRKAMESFLPMEQLRPKLDALEALLAGSDANAVREILQEIVVEFAPNSELVDWVTLRAAANREKSQGDTPVNADNADECPTPSAAA